MWERGLRGNNATCSALHHFPHSPQANWALVVLIPRWVVLCTFQDPMGLSKALSCEAGSFSCCHNPHRIFQSEVLRLYFPALEPWVLRLPHSPFVPPRLFIPKFVSTQFASHHLAMSSLHPGFPSLPLLLVSMNASLTPLLLDFHTVRFPGSSGYILLLNLLFSFFWLCKEKNVSTYAFILSGRFIDVIFDTFITFTTATLLHLLHSVFFRNFPQIHHIYCLSLYSVIIK